MAEDTKKQPDEQKDEPSKEVENSVPEENKVEASEVENKIEEIKIEEPKEEVPAEEATEKQPEEPEKEQLPDFRVGDTVKLSYRIIEGEKTRIQPFQGIVISKKGEGISKTFTVRRIGADKVGVERIIPLYSPNIEKLEVTKKGKVRRAKLYYLRDKKGREAMRIKERK
ncbi:50S ribosomal protein L19 [Patescibacteria group bacterium]|nr:50S ribosomal protein L19 [Patescibacteria group bacterium]